MYREFSGAAAGAGVMPADIRIKPEGLDLVCNGVSEGTRDASGENISPK